MIHPATPVRPDARNAARGAGPIPVPVPVRIRAGTAFRPARPFSPRRVLRALAPSLAIALPLALAPPLAPDPTARAGPATFEPEGLRPVAVRATPIRRFHLLGNRAGGLDFLGGLVLRARAPLASLSGLDRLGPDAYLAVTDVGDWVRLDVARDARGRLASATARAGPIATRVRGRSRDKSDIDAESVRLLPGGDALVAFERRNRVERYAPDGRLKAALPLPIPARELRRNQGLETVALAPVVSPLGGATLVIAERSLDAAGDIFGAVLSGPRRGVFKLRRSDGFDVTDAAFLPGGDLVVLERAYDGRLSLRVRVRRIAGTAIRPGARLDGPVLMEAGLASEIDNLEGLAVHEDARGTVLTLVSDDNGRFYQRTLLLEFALRADAPAPPGEGPPAPPSDVPVPRMRPS